MPTLSADNVSVYHGDKAILDQISFKLFSGDHLAILGDTGSGKTTLGKVLSRKIYHRGTVTYSEVSDHHIAWIPQQHFFKNKSNTADFYYQQRFNAIDLEVTPTVIQYLGDTPNAHEILNSLDLLHLKDSELLMLSNGEHKKLQIAQMLLSHPAVMVWDQPFIGLDKSGRQNLHHIINRLANQGILIILITNADEIPDCITVVIGLENGKIKFKTHPAQLAGKTEAIESNAYHESFKNISNKDTHSFKFDTAIQLEQVTIRYEPKTILKDITWIVRRGERWLLSGPNGAGKSTLLSLITADNPQSYACRIHLFDQKRGSGESIWDIKKKIGYLSPELHVFYDKNYTVYETIASGWFDTIGLYHKINDLQHALILDWMMLAEINLMADKRLYELSVGLQRIVLLLRALVKNPPLLILDEPCQGLDNETELKMISLIETVCNLGEKTMIYVSHYEAKKPDCIKYILELKDGEILRIGSL